MCLLRVPFPRALEREPKGTKLKQKGTPTMIFNGALVCQEAGTDVENVPVRFRALKRRPEAKFAGETAHT